MARINQIIFNFLSCKASNAKPLSRNPGPLSYLYTSTSSIAHVLPGGWRWWRNVRGVSYNIITFQQYDIITLPSYCPTTYLALIKPACIQLFCIGVVESVCLCVCVMMVWLKSLQTHNHHTSQHVKLLKCGEMKNLTNALSHSTFFWVACFIYTHIPTLNVRPCLCFQQDLSSFFPREISYVENIVLLDHGRCSSNSSSIDEILDEILNEFLMFLYTYLVNFQASVDYN